MAFTEYDLAIGIALYVFAVVNLIYSAWYYAQHPIPLIIPDDDEANITRQRQVLRQHRRLKLVSAPLQWIVISIGTLLIFGLEIAIVISFMALLATLDSIISKEEENNFPVDYLLMRLEAVKVADYAIRDEISRFVKRKYISDGEKIRVLDHLILREDLVAEIAQEFREKLEDSDVDR